MEGATLINLGEEELQEGKIAGWRLMMVTFET